ncbi:sulfite exporter TauE/SafE family protein [Flavihumibacter sp. RY-1]|uniref:Probable membrane transporter protein n=1 Tax=Flavihumibacter fluminis TaxID=2909236 RepID=A0ABS9BE34_9BACT|nr:TSUP family transporter [Flavihumibacter fluminis]MCF1713347.1 sulfite exporter TauE/SafE family protein [Flavihumibacter fluminis]
MPASELILIIGIGLLAGVLSGLVGIGGGIVLVPALVYFLKYSQHQAQGTSLGVLMLPVVFLGFYQYYKYAQAQGTPIDLKVVGLLAVGFILGGLLGGKIATRIDGELMKKIFAVLMLYSAVKLLHWDQVVLRWIKSVFS